jgi:hypothetical protein
MDLKANVKYNNGNACFTIHKDSPGVYHADLVYFDGDNKFSPPKKITLVRGIRQWAGSYDNSDLLNELGKIIEESYSNLSGIGMSR